MLDQNGKELTADLTSKISAARLAVLVFNGAAVAKLAEARTFQEARIEAAVLQIRSLEEACQAYSLKNGEFPKTLDVLAKDGKIDREILTDPWDKKFRYDPAGPKHKGNKPDIWTVTPDGRTIGNFDTPKEGTKSPEK